MIATFYSYKGGTGRTLALANVAVLLARQGHRVLAVDFDLEAPGLSRYLQAEAVPGVILDEEPGLIDLLEQVSPSREPPDWQDYVTELVSGLSLLTSGRRDDGYPARVLGFDWDLFFTERGGGEFIERMRNDWRDGFDFVLIDSRTGITDIGGICTIQLPDVIVAVFTASEQSVVGVLDVLARAQRGRQALAYDRPPAAVVPLPSRFEAQTEHELARRWLDRFANDFAPHYESWVPAKTPVRLLLERTALPYIPYFSYGEPLPVLTEGTTAPGSLGYALATITNLLAGRLGNADEIVYGGERPAADVRDAMRRIAAAEALVAKADARAADGVWPALGRMVRIEPARGEEAGGEEAGGEEAGDRVRDGAGEDGGGDTGLTPSTVDLTEFDEPVAQLLRQLPVIRAVGDSAVWADDAIVAQWTQLAERVDADRDFLLWAQRLRDASRDWVAPLTGAELVDALAWRRERADDLTRAEHAYLDYSEREQAQTRQRAIRRHRLLATGYGLLVGVAVGIASYYLSPDQPPAGGTGGVTWAVLITIMLVGGVAGSGFGYWLDALWHGAHRRVTVDLRGQPAPSVRPKLVEELARFGYRLATETPRLAHFTPRSGWPRLPGRLAGGTDAAERDVYLLVHRDTAGEHLVLSAPRSVIRRLARRDDLPEVLNAA